ncbi:hypothetical protein DSO57_1012067 [Entomophthora muscae]|uniref:Uncharacterized protein n=1 Tax=Entomophthora muscae TaxID=34485 RepID=A0ACC2RX13_9FUNG|nr:hypothetical protein DSO57_1012067 [Entomophthora muscae]
MGILTNLVTHTSENTSKLTKETEEITCLAAQGDDHQVDLRDLRKSISALSDRLSRLNLHEPEVNDPLIVGSILNNGTSKATQANLTPLGTCPLYPEGSAPPSQPPKREPPHKKYPAPLSNPPQAQMTCRRKHYYTSSTDSRKLSEAKPPRGCQPALFTNRGNSLYSCGSFCLRSRACKPNSMFKTKLSMNFLIDVRMWLSIFELDNQGLDKRKLGLACICLLEDPVLAAISQYLPQPYKYLDVKKVLLKFFDSKPKDYIDRDNFLEYQIKNMADYPDEFQQMVACLQQKDLINVNDARQSLYHSILSQFFKLWAGFSGQVNGLNDLSRKWVYDYPSKCQLATVQGLMFYLPDWCQSHLLAP